MVIKIKEVICILGGFGFIFLFLLMEVMEIIEIWNIDKYIFNVKIYIVNLVWKVYFCYEKINYYFVFLN